ncbi:alpha-ketoglutarate-dependent dioxygenase AlkB [Beijerinckia sp. L45]|uniref:alpha-ketoglutarate-dependent dioxygenase AlkB n=1 Tax=Beijerinckia sp. L45 TaxID=1641855 RepID=UPI00131BEAFA|nr:alpha-ketoglutarate-dependent dioxygenase AlkB [Beijerinckia sp. L45]
MQPAAEATVAARTRHHLLSLAPGLLYVPGYFDRDEQAALLDQLRGILADAPLFQPVMPKTGTPFSVRMSNCGPLGWVSDRNGYRYQPMHPVTARPWPTMPALARRAWADLGDYPDPSDACLINYYDRDARMGLHQDRDEEGFAAPVVSLSLGDTCVFRYGSTERRGPTKSLKLSSGDAIVLGGAARLAFHGVDRILGGSSTLLAEGGRFNLTLRRVAGEVLEGLDPR